MASTSVRWKHPAVRGGVAGLLFLAYPWGVLALHPVAGEAAMIVGVVPVIATAGFFGTPVGLGTIVLVSAVDGMLAQKLGINPELAPRAALVTLVAYALLATGVGTLRHLWLRLGEVNRSLAGEVRMRQEMGAELEANAALHASLFRCMGEGVGLFDGQDRFVYANAAAERLFSVRPGELVGRSLRDLVEPEALLAVKTGHAAQEATNAYELTTLAQGGEQRHLLVTETSVEAPGAPGCSVLRVMHDVTVRERLERERRNLAAQVQRSEAVQSLGVLAGGVAHDFNNLLTGVLGNADLALLRIERGSPQQAQACLREIQDFGREAAALAKQMLAYAGKGALVTEVLSLGEIATEALRLVQSTVAARAQLEQDISSAPRVRGDRTQLRQIIVNLIMNAVEALGEERGAVRLSIEEKALGCNDLGGLWKPERPEPGQYVMLCVRDCGKGMSQATLERVFEPYFSTKVTGRGMGLAATLGIVRAHGGTIGVESTPGLGSSFRVLFRPEHEVAARPSGVTARGAPARGSGLILLIDDERAVRSAASRMLEELGYRVLVAASGREGLQRLLAESAAIRLVLLDLTMPEMDGRETLLEIRRAGHSVPVLLTSGYHPGEVASLLEEPGVVGFLQKPLQLERLARALREALPEAREAPRIPPHLHRSSTAASQ